MFYDLAENVVEISSGDLNYVSFGKGKSNLIIIQGLNVRDIKGAGASLALMYKIFAKEYRVWFFDRRLEVEEGLTNWDFSNDIYEAAVKLHIGKADVFGVSQGGMIAMALAIEHPDMVSKLVLVVTSSRANDNIKTTVGRWVEYAHKMDYISINKETFSLMYTEKYLRKYKALMPLLVRLVKPRDFNRFAILASAILDFDCYERLPEIKCPVLVLGGDKDRI